MNYGTEVTIYPLDEKGSTLSKIEKFRKDEIVGILKHYRIRVHVMNAQQEMAEFIKFTDELAKKRANGTLIVDVHDSASYPSFIIDYPKTNVDGSYFVIKCYTISV